MFNLLNWYEEHFEKIRALKAVRHGACYRIGDGHYVGEREFEGCFACAREQALCMLLRNAEMMGELEYWAEKACKHLEDNGWLEGTLDTEFIEADCAGCYFTEL